jgi:hypothetical protein
MSKRIEQYKGYTIKERKEGYKIYKGRTVINPTMHYPAIGDAMDWIDKNRRGRGRVC